MIRGARRGWLRALALGLLVLALGRQAALAYAATGADLYWDLQGVFLTYAGY